MLDGTGKQVNHLRNSWVTSRERRVLPPKHLSKRLAQVLDQVGGVLEAD